MSIATPHDALFKRFFEDMEITKDFLNNYLPEEIKNMVDLDTLNLENTSHVDKNLKEVLSDLLFTADISGTEGYLYFLFEHKSYISEDISLQLLKYMVEIWIKAHREIRGNKIGKLPIIIPLVIYHGEDKWEKDYNLKKLIKKYEELPEEIQRHIPSYEYLLYDISRYKDEDLKGEMKLQIFMRITKAASLKDKNMMMKVLIEAIIYLGALEESRDKGEYLEILLRYVFGAKVDFTKKDLDKIKIGLEENYFEGSDIMSSLADILREEGMEKGIEKGEYKTLTKNLITLLTIKFGTIPTEIKQ